MRIIRASEIGTFIFCHRAWWYNIQGFPPENSEDIEAGFRAHAKHNKQISQVRYLRLLSYLALFTAIFLTFAFLIAGSLD